MATYDLICDACGNDFEVFRQGFLRDEDRVCPACGNAHVRQKFSSFLKNIGGSSSASGLREGSSRGGCSAPSGSPFG